MNEKLSNLNMEIENILNNKKSFCKHYNFSDNLSKKAKKALNDLEHHHDTSFAVEYFKRNSQNMM